MEIDEYKNLYNLEASYWWHAGLRNLIYTILKNKFLNIENLKILDAGCGTGATLIMLNKFGDTIGIDRSEHALKYSRCRGMDKIIQGSITDLPFKNNQFDIIISLDVLCHNWIDDDLKVLKEFNRVLKRSGISIINLPAYELLRSVHDKHVHTKRRYSRKELENKLLLTGFGIEKITYRNTFLFPVLLIIKTIKKIINTNGNSKSDLNQLPGLVNNLLLNLLKFENSIIKKTNLPFGSSVFCVAYKN